MSTLSAFAGRPYGVCMRCGFKRRLKELKKEWTGLRVCPPCFDPRPADTRAPKVGAEGLPKRNASPDPDPIYRDPNDNGRSAL